MWIPDPIYKALPPVYGTVGVATTAYLSIAPGLLLITAAAIIWWQRREFRRELEAIQSRRRNVRRNAERAMLEGSAGTELN